MRQLKAIAIDYDSTVTDHFGRLNLTAVERIRFLEDNGIRVILDTSRDYQTAGTLSYSMGCCGLVAAEDGSVIGSIPHLFEGPRIIGDMSKVEAGLQALTQAYNDRIIKIFWPGRLCSYVLARVEDFTAAEGNEILAASGTGAQLMDSGFTYHIVDACTDKGRGLREAANILGILPNEFAAIGDNYNDMPMFTEAGYSIAVGNAPEVVKQQVDYACQEKYGNGFIEGVDHILALFRPDLMGLVHPQKFNK